MPQPAIKVEALPASPV